MIVPFEQRWRRRCATFVPPSDSFRRRDHEVAPIARKDAKAFVIAHHYSKSFPVAVWNYGLFTRAGALVGVAVFSEPVRKAVFDPLPRDAATELGRFVLLDGVGFGGETAMLTRCMELLRREGPVGFVSFSDPFPRTTRAGATVFAGHLGRIYQLKGATYLGQRDEAWVRLLDDGRILSARALAKVRARDKGWRYVVEDLVEAGATPPAATTATALTAWLRAELPRITRRVKHTGNHKYAFALDAGVASSLPASKPYPRIVLPPRVCVPFEARAVAA